MKSNFNQAMQLLKNINIESNKNKIITISYIEDNKNKLSSFKIRDDFSELIRKTILLYKDDNIYFLYITLDDKIIFKSN